MLKLNYVNIYLVQLFIQKIKRKNFANMKKSQFLILIFNLIKFNVKIKFL